MPVSQAVSTGGAQVSLAEYRNLTRDELNDWDYEDRLQTALGTSDTTVDVLDGTKFGAGHIIQIDSEYMYVSSVSSNALTVRRNWRRSTATTHAAGATILRDTTWTDNQLGNWVNESFDILYPWFYIRAEEELTGSSTTFDYTLNSAITDISQVERIEAKYSSVDTRDVVRGNLVRLRDNGSNVKLYLPAGVSGYTLTVTYTKPFPQLESDTDRTTLPTKAKLLPVYYAASRALEQREALRSRYDGYEVTQNERMVREGQQIATGSYYWQRFEKLRSELKMPPAGRL